MKTRADSENVSPTAYATGYFWYRHGLSHAGLLIPEGKRADRGFRWLIRLVRAMSRIDIEAMMLARHQGLDAILSREIEAGRVSQVIELAAGLSPRGWRITKKYGDRVNYIETDLPRMAALKHRLLGASKLYGPKHRVTTVNALIDKGAESLETLAKSLDPKQGLAIITEGLMSYLDPASAEGVWRRIAKVLGKFPHGVYLSDLYLRRDRHGIGMLVFRSFVQSRVRGRMHVHFRKAEDVQKLKELGFAEVTLHEPRNIEATRELGQIPGGDRVRVLEAHP